MHSRFVAFGLSAAVVLLDRLTKLWVESAVGRYETIPVIPGFFDIIYTRNRGIAFGLFADSGGYLRSVLLVGVAVAVLGAVAVLIWRLPRNPTPSHRWFPFALGLIFGGAAGNLYDRIVHGSVTDFLDVYVGDWHWPAFNIADSAITIGAVLLLMESVLRPRQMRES